MSRPLIIFTVAAYGSIYCVLIIGLVLPKSTGLTAHNALYKLSISCCCSSAYTCFAQMQDLGMGISHTQECTVAPQSSLHSGLYLGNLF